jgi:cephalosporin-C deacetylase-like acetyl esterase
MRWADSVWGNETMRHTKKLYKEILTNYVIHSFCLLIEVLKGLGYIDLAMRAEDIKEEVLEKMEKGGRLG